ncbi:nuclease [Candidatus Kaiserbacteria bacterium]|nr:MAG: nuclease [Candidatus Kaiserbacteria bacterium]
MFKLLLVLSILSSFTAVAEENCQHVATTFRCVKYLKNYDADTVTVEIPNVHPLLGKKISIRIIGVDTPELRTKNQCEKKLGYIAKNKVAAILRGAKRIDLINVKRGKYFRIVGDLIVDGLSLSTYLLKEKLAYPYDGGTKAKIDWCRDGGLKGK